VFWLVKFAKTPFSLFFHLRYSSFRNIFFEIFKRRTQHPDL
jgi:hypothetical protein